MQYHVGEAVGKGTVGIVAVVAAATIPSNYVSFFDRVYDWGWVLISGNDIARMLGVFVSFLVAVNIIYTVFRSILEKKRENRAKKRENRAKNTGGEKPSDRGARP